MSPAVPLFAAAAVGALLGLSAQIAPSLILGVSAFVLAAVLGALASSNVASPAVRAALVIGLGGLAGFGGGACERARHHALVAALPADAVFEGIIVDDQPARGGGRRLLLDVDGALPHPESELSQSVPARGRLMLRLLAGASAFTGTSGDRVRVRARARPLAPADQPGTFDAELFALARGIHGRASLRDPTRLVVVARAASWTPLADARQWLRSRLMSLLTPREAGVVLALLVGETSTFDQEQLDVYRAVGAGHLLAVSGLQVSLIAVLVFLLVRSLLLLHPVIGRRSRARFPAALVALAAVWMFVGLCGAPPSCVRAGAMASAGLLAALVGRRAAGLDALGLAGLLTVLVSPSSVVDPSFLLSYAAVLGLVAATPLRETPLRVPDDTIWTRLRGRGQGVLVGSLAAGLLTLPISAHLFGELSLGGIPANVVLVPAAATLQVPAIGLGLLGALLDVGWIAAGGAACAGLLEALTEGLAHLVGGVVTVPAPGAWTTAGWFAAALLGAVGLARAPRRRWWGAALAVGLAALVVPSLLEPQGARLTVLPVGQGDGAVFELPDGTVFVVDGGGVWDERVDPGESVVVPFLRRRGISRVDVVVLSHPDPDHLLGLLTVLSSVEVGELWHSGISRAHPLVARLLDVAAAHDVKVKTARELLGVHRFGAAAVEVVAPSPEDGSLVYEELSANDNSLVMKVSLGQTSALWVGDVEEWGERYLLRDHPAATGRLHATVLKAPHHGSRTSSSAELIEAVGAAHVVFPTGRDNQWGFPHPEVVERYRATGAKLWDTAVHGELTLWLSEHEVVVEPYRDGAR